MIDHGSFFQIQIMDPKMWFAHSKIEVLVNFCFILFAK